MGVGIDEHGEQILTELTEFLDGINQINSILDIERATAFLWVVGDPILQFRQFGMNSVNSV
jgi:hypothetical protein